MVNQAQKLKQIVKDKKVKKTNTKFIAITSGKGGVGKSTISANIANILAENGYKVGLFDADLGLANLDVILNTRIGKNLLHVFKGECKLDEIIVQIKKNLVLIPGESGDEILKYNNHFLYESFLEDAKILDDLDYMIIDTGAGIGETMQTFLEAADEVIIVTIPDPAAITDAYATIKVTSRIKDSLLMILNMSKNDKEAKSIFEKIKKVALNNLGEKPELVFLGSLLQDKVVSNSIKQRTLFTDDAPNSVVSAELKSITSRLTYRLERKVLVDDGSRSFGRFFRRLIEQF